MGRANCIHVDQLHELIYVRKSDCDGDVANLTARNSILGVFPLHRQIDVT